MKSFLKLLKAIGNAVLWLFVIFAVCVTVMVLSSQRNKDGLPNLAGKSLINILSDSMSPTFESGDLILDNSLSDDEKQSLKVDDIITFYSDLDGDGNDEINTHRIIEVKEENGTVYYVTQGDNKATNPEADEPVIYKKVLGVYSGTKFGGVGRIIAFLQTSTGFLCAVIIPLALFFLFELYNFITVIIRVKSKGKLSKEDEEEIKRRAIEEYLREHKEEAPGNEVSKNE